MVCALAPLKKTSPPTLVDTPLMVAVWLLPNLSHPPLVLMLWALTWLMPSPELSVSAHRCRLSLPPVLPRLALMAMWRAAYSVSVVSAAPVLLMALLRVMSPWLPLSPLEPWLLTLFVVVTVTSLVLSAVEMVAAWALPMV